MSISRKVNQPSQHGTQPFQHGIVVKGRKQKEERSYTRVSLPHPNPRGKRALSLDTRIIVVAKQH